MSGLAFDHESFCQWLDQFHARCSWHQVESSAYTQESCRDCNGIGAGGLCEWASGSRYGWGGDRWRRRRRDSCRCNEAELVLLLAAPSPPLRAMLTHRSVFVASRVLLRNAIMRV